MPVIGLVQVGTQSRADRYTYLPMIGVYLMVVWLLKEAADRWPKTRISLAAAAVLVFTVLSAITFRQVSYWIDTYTLFEHAVDVTDNNWFAYNHIGIAYDKDAKAMATADLKTADALFDRAARHFKRPPKIRDPRSPPLPDDTEENFQAAVKKLDRGQKRELLFDYSAENFKASIDIKPDYDFGNNNLGVYYAHPSPTRDIVKAEQYFKQALRSNGRYADAYNNLGIVLAEQGKLDEAILCHLAELKIFDHRASDHNNLSRAYLLRHDFFMQKNEAAKAKDDLDSAFNQFLLALHCDPNFLAAWMTGAEIYVKQGKFDEAVKCIQRMTAIDAGSPLVLQAPQQDGGILPRQQALRRGHFLPQPVLGSQQVRADIYNLRAFAYVKNDLKQALDNVQQQRDNLMHALEDFEQVVAPGPAVSRGLDRVRAIRERLALPPK